jgi:hypothetical protein
VGDREIAMSHHEAVVKVIENKEWARPYRPIKQEGGRKVSKGS